jgi:hypothetical protein
MKRIKLPSILALSLLVIALPLAAPAADTAEKPAAADTAKKTEKYTSYQGSVSAVDKDKKTFTVTAKKGDLVISVTDTTKMLNKATKQTATFDDIAVGGPVSGSYLKNGDALEAHSVHLGKGAPAKGSKKAKATPSATPDAPAK